MKILYLITSSSLADGIAQHIVTLCCYFKTVDSVDIAVCVTHGEGEFTNMLRCMGVRVYTLNCAHGHEIKIFRRFHKVMKDFRPTIIHSHVMAFNVRVYLSLVARHIPVVRTLHVIPDVNKKISECLKSVVENCFMLNLRNVLAVSAGVKEAYKGTGLWKKISVIYNSISLNNLPGRSSEWIKKELGISQSVRLIGFIGRLAEVKDLPSFLEIARLLIEKSSNYHFVIVGNGPEETLKDSTLAQGMSKNLHWMGYRTDAKRIMSALDVFLLTSFKEAMPTVLLEAFSMRTPVCAFASSGGVEEVIRLGKNYEKGIARFVDNRDVVRLASEITATLEDSEVTASQTENAFDLVSSKFDINVVGPDIYVIYKRIAS